MEYPHFENVKSSFDNYFNMFSSFLKNELGVDAINIQVAELTYSNLIDSGEYWADPSDTPRLIPTLSIPDPGMPIEGKGLCRKFRSDQHFVGNGFGYKADGE